MVIKTIYFICAISLLVQIPSIHGGADWSSAAPEATTVPGPVVTWNLKGGFPFIKIEIINKNSNTNK